MSDLGTYREFDTMADFVKEILAGWSVNKLNGDLTLDFDDGSTIKI